MRRAGGLKALAASLLLLCGLPPAPVAGLGGRPALADSSPWRESTPGLFDSLPERTVTALDNGVRGTFRLSPGEGILVEREMRRPLDNGATLALELFASGTNASSKDYAPGAAAFPVAVTVVFGEDSAGRPWTDLLYDFFRGRWYGLLSRGMRLTYAWGNDSPVLSMYRLVEDETVFVLAGPDEAGKTVTAARNLKADFEAAYARGPKGPVTRLIVRAERPSADNGAITSRVLLRFPPR